MKLAFCMSLPLLAVCAFLLAGCAKKSEDFLQSGLTHASKHKYQEALSDFDNAIKLDSNNARAFLERGLIACRTGYTKPIGDDLSKYIQFTAPKLAIAFIGRALANRLDHNFHESLNDLDRAIAIDPTNIQGFVFKKEVLQESGDTLHLQQFISGLDAQTLDRIKNYVPPTGKSN
jgi:tetratricopeptide (TPR) repeat protein